MTDAIRRLADEMGLPADIRTKDDLRRAVEGQASPINVGPSLSPEERWILQDTIDRENCCKALADLERIHDAIRRRHIDSQCVLELNFLVDTAWNHRHTCKEIRSGGESAFRRFCREVPMVVVQVSRLLDVQLALDRSLSGPELIRWIYEAQTFWVEANAVAQLNETQLGPTETETKSPDTQGQATISKEPAVMSENSTSRRPHLGSSEFDVTKQMLRAHAGWKSLTNINKALEGHSPAHVKRGKEFWFKYYELLPILESHTRTNGQPWPPTVAGLQKQKETAKKQQKS